MLIELNVAVWASIIPALLVADHSKILRFSWLHGLGKNSKEDLRRATHENLANGFEMRISGLDLLR
jgi:cell division inhibitor SulA